MRTHGSPQLTAALMHAEFIHGLRDMEWESFDELQRQALAEDIWGALGAFKEVALENENFYDTRFFPEYIAGAWFFNVPAFREFEAKHPQRLPIDYRGQLPDHSEMQGFWHALNRMETNAKLRKTAQAVWARAQAEPPKRRQYRGKKLFSDYPGLQ